MLFKNESSVHKLLISCIPEGEKYFIYMPSSNLSKKKVSYSSYLVNYIFVITSSTRLYIIFCSLLFIGPS